jgi:hypothetical protein
MDQPAPAAYATLPIPDARASDPLMYREEVQAAVRYLRLTCTGPDGQEPSIAQIAELLGVGRTTLADWVTDRGVGRPRANPGFTSVYALRALVAAPVATRAALWGEG